MVLLRVTKRKMTRISARVKALTPRMRRSTALTATTRTSAARPGIAGMDSVTCVARVTISDCRTHNPARIVSNTAMSRERAVRPAPTLSQPRAVCGAFVSVPVSSGEAANAPPFHKGAMDQRPRQPRSDLVDDDEGVQRLGEGVKVTGDPHSTVCRDIR